MHEFIHYNTQKFQHKDLNHSRIKNGERDVIALLEILTNLFVQPFSDNPLLCISNGMVAPAQVCEDVKDTFQKGKEAMETFINDYLLDPSEIDFYQLIKKMKLQTFSSMRNVVEVTVEDRVIAMKAHSKLFGRLAIAMQTCQVDLKDVFSYPLGPHPW